MSESSLLKARLFHPLAKTANSTETEAKFEFNYNSIK